VFRWVFVMGISVAQLNMLAEHFKFDINEARQLVGLSTTTKTTKTTKSTTTKVKNESAPKKRGRTGYNHWCENAKCRVADELKQSKGCSKLARGELVSELSKRWKLLPEGTREMWNAKASQC